MARRRAADSGIIESRHAPRMAPITHSQIAFGDRNGVRAASGRVSALRAALGQSAGSRLKRAAC
jgi:hypothetical protein